MVDPEGNTIDCLLCATRDAKAAERFFYKAVQEYHTTIGLSHPGSIRGWGLARPELLGGPFRAMR